MILLSFYLFILIIVSVKNYCNLGNSFLRGLLLFVRRFKIRPKRNVQIFCQFNSCIEFIVCFSTVVNFVLCIIITDAKIVFFFLETI